MKRLCLCAIAYLFCLAPLYGATIYVDDVTAPQEDGSAQHPFDAIQQAVDAAWDGDTVLVLDGTYTGAGNRDIDFGGKAIAVRSQNGPGACVIDSQGTPQDPHRGFFFHSGEAASSVLDGFTITSGCASGTQSAGGGVYCEGSSPTIMNCNIAGNTAALYGGGVYVTACSPVITNCRIAGNSTQVGGGIFCESSAAIISANTISGNFAAGGAGIFCEFNSPTITHNRIVDNVSSDNGGGIYCSVQCSAVIESNTFWGNSARFYGAGFHCIFCSPTIRNCIFWGNAAASGHEIALELAAQPTVCYSDIQGGKTQVYVEAGSTLNWGLGNLFLDPLFAGAAQGDFHLRSLSGRWDPVAQQWVVDTVHSPCIDAGDPASPWSLEPRFNGWRINMGAHGNTPEASKSFPMPDVYPDECVNVADLLMVRNNLGKSGSGMYPQSVDVNRDGVCNVADLLIVRNNMGRGPGCH